ncbi:DUF3012 domain-containing protein [Vibrio sp. NH-7]
MKKLPLVLFALVALSACKDEVGTQNWCDSKAQGPKSEWSAQDALDYAKHCVLQDAVGSESWCESMSDKPKGDWSANEAKNFATHCIL